MTDSERITDELDKIQKALNSGELTPREYEQLYAAQQGLTWALDEDKALAPFDTVMQRKVQAPIKNE